MKIFFLILFLSLANSLLAQSNDSLSMQAQDSATFQAVEIEASVDAKLWRSHLEKSLGPILIDLMKKGMKPGKYVVQVKFLVEKDGNISESNPLNEPGFDLGKKAAEVVLKGPKWTPGIQNGKPVRSYHTQPITFFIQPTKYIREN
jgi:protein TonB